LIGNQHEGDHTPSVEAGQALKPRLDITHQPTELLLAINLNAARIHRAGRQVNKSGLNRRLAFPDSASTGIERMPPLAIS